MRQFPGVRGRRAITVVTAAVCICAVTTLMSGCASGAKQPTQRTPTARVSLDASLATATVFVAAHQGNLSGALYAFNAQNGSTRWIYHTAAMYGTPAVGNGTVFIAPQDGYVYALDAATGNRLWSFQRDVRMDVYPTVSGNMVYVASDEGAVYALGVDDGKLRWQFHPLDTGDHIYAAPAVAAGLVFVSMGGVDQYFYALDANTGHIKWRVAANGGFDGVPAATSDTVYVGANDDSLYAVNSASGAVRWHHATGGAVIALPAVTGDALFAGSTDGSLYALHTADGSLAWQSNPPNASGEQAGAGISDGVAAAVSGNMAFVNTIGGITYALDAGTGNELWRFKEGSNLPAQPAASGGAVFVAAFDGTVLGLRASDGALGWKFDSQASIYAPPVVMS